MKLFFGIFLVATVLFANVIARSKSDVDDIGHVKRKMLPKIPPVVGLDSFYPSPRVNGNNNVERRVPVKRSILFPDRDDYILNSLNRLEKVGENDRQKQDRKHLNELQNRWRNLWRKFEDQDQEEYQNEYQQREEEQNQRDGIDQNESGFAEWNEGQNNEENEVDGQQQQQQNNLENIDWHYVKPDVPGRNKEVDEQDGLDQEQEESQEEDLGQIDWQSNDFASDEDDDADLVEHGKQQQEHEQRNDRHIINPIEWSYKKQIGIPKVNEEAENQSEEEESQKSRVGWPYADPNEDETDVRDKVPQHGQDRISPSFPYGNEDEIGEQTNEIEQENPRYPYQYFGWNELQQHVDGQAQNRAPARAYHAYQSRHPSEDQAIENYRRSYSAERKRRNILKTPSL